MIAVPVTNIPDDVDHAVFGFTATPSFLRRRRSSRHELLQVLPQSCRTKQKGRLRQIFRIDEYVEYGGAVGPVPTHPASRYMRHEIKGKAPRSCHRRALQ